MESVLPTDITFEYQLYTVNTSVILNFLNKGEILIGVLVMDSLFLKEVLPDNNSMQTLPNDNKLPTVSDFVLIIGWVPETKTSKSFIIVKTNWQLDPIEIPVKFINNFKELWNITVKSPEEKM